ncbi:two-component system sensor histidine kinase NtrB [Maricaulis maris]|jgi:two-component system, NtrC family, nitrogen regulation sensor histidine kinase GlnL|uniref:two-component system sensor histidine kinase NtrB n=1 Tax=Maricaulis maris TaxID=74318 RepID=UPI002920AFC0|nr:ATPase [Maricaulis maris]
MSPAAAPGAASLAASLAADQAAIPILVFSGAARCVWANTQAEEWLGLSMRHMGKGRFDTLSATCAQLADIIEQACGSQRTVVALGRMLGGGGPFDVHARWSEEHGQLVLSVLPHQEMGAKASEAPALGFGRMLAHELKNPLASVRGAAQLIRRETGIEGARDLARLIIQDVDRITRLADHWSRVGDIQLGVQSEINLNLLAVNAMDSLHRADAATRGVLRENFDPSLPTIKGDPDLLMQVVLNLLQNALDAVRSDPAAEIVIETRFDAGPKSRTGGNPTPLVLSVRDNGPGIPETLGSGIFTPFVTTKPAGEGLGLAFAARIAALHDGQIDFESHPGRTVFNIRLPIAKRDLP